MQVCIARSLIIFKEVSQWIKSYFEKYIMDDIDNDIKNTIIV